MIPFTESAFQLSAADNPVKIITWGISSRFWSARNEGAAGAGVTAINFYPSQTACEFGEKKSPETTRMGRKATIPSFLPSCQQVNAAAPPPGRCYRRLRFSRHLCLHSPDWPCWQAVIQEINPMVLPGRTQQKTSVFPGLLGNFLPLPLSLLSFTFLYLLSFIFIYLRCNSKFRPHDKHNI